MSRPSESRVDKERRDHSDRTGKGSKSQRIVKTHSGIGVSSGNTAISM